MRPAIIILCGYIALTLFSTAFQEAGSVQLVYEWIGLSLKGAGWGINVNDGHISLQNWLKAFGIKGWDVKVSLTALSMLGLWIYKNRKGDIWILLGVTALVSRFWVHHLWYDDLLVLLPMITLIRIVKQESSATGIVIIAKILLGITILVMLAPGGLYLFPPPWNSVYITFETAVWIVLLIFLLIYGARCEKQTL